MPHRFKQIYDLRALNFLQNCNLKIGLLGGSFNPAHIGHLRITEQAIKKFGLDYVIWLVALQNPFKAIYGADIFTRAQKAALLVNNPRILISTAEYDLNIKYTYQILKYFKERFKALDITWLMGADSLAHFHKWEYSALIPDLCKVIIFDRPGFSCFFNFSKFTSSFDKKKNIILYKAIRNNVSSTLIRQNQINI